MLARLMGSETFSVNNINFSFSKLYKSTHMLSHCS
jgi:hypothetical protein